MSATKNLPTLRITGNIILPDSEQYINRFEIHSETSDRIYIISQNRKKRHWCCSCPSWRVRRSCKHLTAIGLPAFEKPYEVKLVK